VVLSFQTQNRLKLIHDNDDSEPTNERGNGNTTCSAKPQNTGVSIFLLFPKFAR